MKEKSKESNFIRHWVKIRLEGFKPERLISQAIDRGIPLRGIHYKDETEVYFTVAEEDYQRLKKMGKSKYRFSLIKEGGSRPAAKKLMAKKLMIVGIGIFLLFLLYQSAFVKEINVIGCQSIPEEEIRQCLKEEGLYEGALKEFDCENLERKLFKKFDHIVWARVAYEGNFVQVEISENTQNGRKEINEKPCNIVAEKDCYIEQILAYYGRSVVQKDAFVRKGDILITGTIPIEHPSYPLGEKDPKEHYVAASGRITARVPYDYRFYMEKGSSEDEAKTMVRQWIAENIPKKAQILNKSLNFAEKKNIIRVYGTIETRQQVGKEQEIKIDREKRSTEKDSH